MAYSEKLANRIRELLTDTKNVEEKKMFRGVTFMVNDKMCISVAANEIMCRIDPELHEAAIAKEGCTAVKMKGREYKGYVLVSEEVSRSKKELTYWVSLCLDFNKRAKSSKKKNKL